jgi:hypothetical protein
MPNRPIWGLLRLLLGNMRMRHWHFVGCASPEERTAAAAEAVRSIGGKIASADCLRLQVPADRFSEERERNIDYNLTRIKAALPPGTNVRDMELFGSIEVLDSMVTEWGLQGRQHLLIDISTMPKRVFFPLLKLVLRSRAFGTVMTTYSRPLKYAEEPLAEDPEPPLPLPMFPAPLTPTIPAGGIIALGLEVLGIVDLLATAGGESRVHVLFPIPSKPDESKRTWTFMQRLHDASPGRFTEPRHLSPLDFGEGYSYIRSLTDGFQGLWWLAPYGPKPISMAMAVTAIQHDWPVYYSQPTIYNPAYSIGIGSDGYDPAVYGYLIVHHGELQT